MSESTLTSRMARLSRPQVVVASLLAALTGVGGLLMALEDRPSSPRELIAIDGGQIRHADGARVRAVLTTPVPLDHTRWDGIVIHHSGTPADSPGDLAKRHEGQGLRGLGYHFVIGNGRGTVDGEIHVGYRWGQQLPGAHTSGPDGAYYNRRTIGICLVGDGERRPFTDAQLARLAELVSLLQAEFGIPGDAVRLHSEIASTASPGRLFPEGAFRDRLSRLRRVVATADTSEPATPY